MTNAKRDDQILDAYFVSNLNLAYTFKLPRMKSVTVVVRYITYSMKHTKTMVSQVSG